MLVRITNQCNMQCGHCMVEATPQGKHMTEETFIQTLLFIQKGPTPIVLISGGEPTQHPQITEFLEQTKKAQLTPLLLSNGQFLHQNPELREKILSLVHSVQVTNDPRYYPEHVPDYDHPKVTIVRKLLQLSPHGRQKGKPTNRTAPECYNLRTLIKHGYSFDQAKITLMSKMKFCTPSININGTIVAGEAPSCAAIGHITDDPTTITKNVRELDCDNCGLSKNLPEELRKAGGY